jgi:hypothetical protein
MEQKKDVIIKYNFLEGKLVPESRLRSGSDSRCGRSFISEHPDNDIILGQFMACKIKEARYNKSLNKVCDDLGVMVCA